MRKASVPQPDAGVLQKELFPRAIRMIFVAALLLLLAADLFFGRNAAIVDLVKFNILYLYILFCAMLAAKYRSRTVDPADKLSIISSVVIAGFASAVLYLYFVNVYMIGHFPYNTFLYGAEDKFNDFLNSYNQLTLKKSGPYSSFASSPNNYILSVFSFFFRENWFGAYVLYALAFVFYVMYFIRLYLGQNKELQNGLFYHVVILTLLTYPMLFNLDRGNPEMLVFIILSLSMLCFEKGKFAGSVILIAMIVLMQKVYFAIFLLLFIQKKMYREVLIFFVAVLLGQQIMTFFDKILYAHANLAGHTVASVPAFILLSVLLSVLVFYRGSAGINVKKLKKGIMRSKMIGVLAALSLLGIFLTGIQIYTGDLNGTARKFITGVYNSLLSPNQGYNHEYAIDDKGSFNCSSLYGALKEVAIMLKLKFTTTQIFNVYPLVVAPLILLVLFYVFKSGALLWKNAAVLVLSIFLFPFITADYRLIHILIPMCMFIISKERGRFDLPYALLFGLLLVPNRYFVLRADSAESTITHPLIILVFLLLLIYEGLNKKAQRSAI